MPLRHYHAIEFRAEKDGDTRKISGLAAVYDIETVIGSGFWGFREVIRRGAFTKTLKERDQLLLWSHNSDYPMARTSEGTLRLNDEKRGLEFDADLGEQSWSIDAYESILRRDVKGMSFRFVPVKERWTEFGPDEDEMDLREILEVRLDEVSPVAFPAYPTTEAEARSTIEEARAAGFLKAESEGRKSTDEPEGHSPAGEGDEKEAAKIKADAAARLRKIKLTEWRLRHGI